MSTIHQTGGSLARWIRERRLGVPLSVAGVAFLLSFWQRPAQAWSDTRIELLTEPGLFLSRAASLWTSTIDLGHIQSSQFVGYLFPMGPFFALGHAAGIPMWIVQRLWIGALLAIAGWGIVRLVQATASRAPSSAGLIAGLLYVSSPYVLISLNRGTTWLVPYALLPWMLIWTRRGLRDPRSWVSPAMMAILVAAAGGGLNAAVLAWLVAGAALLALFEALTAVGWRAAIQWGWRTALLCALLSLWWIVPVLAQVRYGTDYLTFTEHPEAILNTPSASESIRLLGYWVGYINGYPDQDPQLPSIGAYLLSAPTIVATFVVPGLAIFSAAIFRHWRYGAFFAVLLALSVLIMSAGFPQGSRVGEAVTNVYYSAGPLQFIRTTYKAAPLAAVSIVVLAGVFLGTLLQQLATTPVRLGGRTLNARPGTVIAALAIVVLVVLWGRPIWSGNAVDKRLFFADVPSAWTEAVADAQKTTPSDTRIAVLPGELFGWYQWAGTQNAVAPALSRKPVIVRQITRPAPALSAELLDAVDSTLQQGRLTPNQLPPLLQLMGVGRVLVGTDTSPQRSEALNPALTQWYLADQRGFERPAAFYGPTRQIQPPANRYGPTVTLAQVLAYSAPRPAKPRIKRVIPAQGAAIVDGDAQGLVSMAAVGALNPTRANFYAGDQSKTSIARLLEDHPVLTFTDSNRRRFRLASRIGLATSQTLPADQPIDREFPTYDPFPTFGSSSQTVAEYSGIRSLTSPASPGFNFFPEHRPYAAIDGDPQTSWIAQSDNPEDRFIDIQLRQPANASAIYVRPHRDRASQTRAVEVSVNDRGYRSVPLSPGFNRVPVAGPIRSLRIRVASRRNYFGLAPAGLDEVRIPGVKAREALRLPTALSQLTDGADLDTVAMQVVLERATTDFPRRSGKAAGPDFALDPIDAVDAESGMRRIVTLPASRSFKKISGWASVRPSAPDNLLDRLVGLGGDSSYTSSNRFEGVPGFRASSAFDGRTDTSWRAEFDPDFQPWVQWSGNESVRIKRLTIKEARGRFLHPTRVFVSTENGGFGARIGRNGLIVLPNAISGRRLRVQVTGVRAVRKPAKGTAAPAAIAIREIDTGGQVPSVSPARSGTFDAGCGALSVGVPGTAAQLQVKGTIKNLNQSRPLAISKCGGAGLALRRGRNLISAHPGTLFSPDNLRIVGTPPSVAALPASKTSPAGTEWVALAESFSPAWRASCRHNSNWKELGSPVMIDGFANGWRVAAGSCTQVRFSFAPQKGATISYLVSGIALLAALAILILGWRRRPKERIENPQEEAWPTLQMSVGDLAASDRAPDIRSRQDRLATLSTWLMAGSAFIVVALGAIYVANPDPSQQGINFDFSLHHEGAHWLAVVAVLLLLGGGTVRVVGAATVNRKSKGRNSAGDNGA